MNLLDERSTTGAIDQARTRVPAGDRKLNIVVHVNGEAKQPAKKKPFCVVKKGSVEIPIYGRKSGPFTIAWYEGRSRKRAMRSDLEDAKKLAGEKATCVANGQSAMAGMDQKDWASYLRALEILQPTGQQLELAVGIYTQCVQKLAAVGLTIEDAIAYALENARANIVPKPCPQIVAELLQSKQDDQDIGRRWLDSLTAQLNRAKDHFTGPLQSVRSADINTWLRSIPGGLRNRANHRSAFLQLINYAKANGYLAKTWDEMDRVAAPNVKDSEIKILTPEQIVKLLTVAPKNIVPFVALTAFAGIRHQEMNGEKALLDWRDIDFDAQVIYVPKGVGKTGHARLVPMQPNLVAWLLPYAKRNGRVCEVSNSSNSLCKAKDKAGIPKGRNETRNTLRKSFISYRLAVTKNIAQVAEEAGNSAAKIKSNYKRPIPEKEGKRWFEIWPTHADIIQLSLGLR